MADSDFLLKISADDSQFKKTIDGIFKFYNNKPLKLKITADIDPKLKSLTNVSKSGKGGNMAGSGLLLTEERRAAKAANALSIALNSCVRSVELFAARLSGGAIGKTASRANFVAAGMAPGVGSAKLSPMQTALFAAPGAVQLANLAAMPVRRAIEFGRSSMSKYAEQQRAELQFRQVLQNAGMGNAEFADIKNYAGQIQGRTMYGDEAMIAGAGELATYVKNPQQMKRMMDLLANYAAGMTNGGEVGTMQMIGLATGLGKAFDGTYDSLREKGFDTSELEALDKLQKKGGVVTDEQKIAALERALADWDGLAEKMAQTDQGKIVQLNNVIGDLQENVGERLYPSVANLADVVKQNLPQLQQLFDSIGNILVGWVEQITKNIDAITSFITGTIELIGTLVSNAKFIANFIVSAKLIGPLFKTTTMEVAAAETQLSTSAQVAASSISKSANEIQTAAQSTNISMNGVGTALSSLKGIAVNAIVAWSASQIEEAISAAWSLYKQKKEQWAFEESEGQRREGQDKMISAYKAWKNGGALRDINERRDLEGAVQSYRAKYGQDVAIPSYILDALGEQQVQQKAAVKKAGSYRPASTRITQNNYISTEFDNLSKLIKENLREIATSRLTFKSSAEAAKAIAL